jgi:hypothetical protein
MDDEDEIIHVYPLFGREHDTDHGAACWCQPEPLPDELRVLVHHVEQ